MKCQCKLWRVFFNYHILFDFLEKLFLDTKERQKLYVVVLKLNLSSVNLTIMIDICLEYNSDNDL